MSVFDPLRRIFAKHFFHHMAIPLLFGGFAEVFLATGTGKMFTLAASSFLDVFWSNDELNRAIVEHSVPIFAIVAAYLVVMYSIAKKETTPPFEKDNIEKVAYQLSDASGYFALCDIPMREWFEPGASKYFSLLLSTKLARGSAFRYERVLVFTTPTRKRAADSQMIDGYHADALAAAHRQLGIPMGKLESDELREILNHSDIRALIRRMKPQHRILLQHIPGRLRALLQHAPERFRPAAAAVLCRCPWPVSLDFAVVDRRGGKVVIIVPFKKSKVIVLQGGDAAPFNALAEAIKAKVYEDDGVMIRSDHDFAHAAARVIERWGGAASTSV